MIHKNVASTDENSKSNPMAYPRDEGDAVFD